MICGEKKLLRLRNMVQKLIWLRIVGSQAHAVPRHVTLIFDVDFFKPALLHRKNCDLLDPEKDPYKNSTPPYVGPTVCANCRGIVTTDVLEQGLSCRAITLGSLKGLIRTKDTREFIY